MLKEIEKFVNEIENKDFARAGESFDGLIASYINDALEQKKISVADGMFKESLDRKPSGKKISAYKEDGVDVEIYKEISGFVVYIDGDRLDSYKSEKDAKIAVTEFLKN